AGRTMREATARRAEEDFLAKVEAIRAAEAAQEAEDERSSVWSSDRAIRERRRRDGEQAARWLAQGEHLDPLDPEYEFSCSKCLAVMNGTIAEVRRNGWVWGVDVPLVTDGNLWMCPACFRRLRQPT